MAQLTKHTAGHIRELYASGLYHKADLAVRFIAHFENLEDLNNVLCYVVFPEVRRDLRIKIFGVPFVQEIAKEYHQELIVAANEEVDNVARLGKDAPNSFPLIQNKADTALALKVSFCNKEFGFSFTVNDLKRRIYRGF